MKLKQAASFFSLLFLFIPFGIKGQTAKNAQVKGRIVDSLSGQPLGFASIQVLSVMDSSLVNGDLSTDDGSFAISAGYGEFFLRLDFMGFRGKTTSSFILSKEHSRHDLGTIQLAPLVSTLEEVVVQAEKSSMQLALDKKIFNVGKDLANAGGSASDILTNIPSVSVDAEGGVKLRGSDNVRILIDGKPSGLVSIKGGSGLQQLQANLVERVEIITNPSARYEAEGMAGIINIVLKKDRSQGFNGSVDLITGNPANFGLAANFNYRRNKLNFFINYGISYRDQLIRSSLYQEVYGDTTRLLEQTNRGTFTGFNNNVRGGLDYFFSEKSILTAAYLYRRSQGNRLLNIQYQDYLENLGGSPNLSKRQQDEDEIEPNSEFSINYKRAFDQKGHELIAEVKYIDYWENSDQTYGQQFFLSDGTEDLSRNLVQKSVNDEFEKQYLLQLDYVRPIGKEGKMETGIRSSFRDMVNDYVVSQKNETGTFIPLPGLDNIFLYDENIHAAYGILGNKSGRFSYQAGLRAEWTDVKTTLQETNQVNPRDYVNLFPSVHLTLSLPRENALQWSYSRRVRRPFYNDLSPYVTFSDARNFFSGNPDLDPEFSNALELGHIKTFEKGSLTSSVYFRNTRDRIERIRLVDESGNSVTRTENLLSERALGVEFTSGYSPLPWWKLDFNFNYFYADIDGTNILPDYRAYTYSWFTRQTSRFTLPRGLDIQLRANYEAPQRTAQGKRKALYFADLSVSKDLWKDKGTLNLSVLDVFNSRRMRIVSEGPNFFTEGNIRPRVRQVNLSLSYRIKQAKPMKPRRMEGEEG
ncbi:MAG TPA: outer membrane beta-barrel family protein [Saprospiraceae bacterium]|nr:outer membrane beta-barrel family protein [Saprospiraceae bacterium]HNT21561.1 outer membrane beta-barrel family protein [Saprospiraceae bacterium]